MENLIIYRDALILVLNKPAGIPVHAGFGPYTPLDIYFEQLKFGLPQAPALAHRLDRETSGCLILGRHKQALKKLGELFSQNKVLKTYWAVVEGIPLEESGIINYSLSRQSSHKHQWWMKIDPQGKPALTHFKVLKTFGQSQTLLELKPLTGRTHQLRVHCAAKGWPIIGDKIYGHFSDARLLLHAYSIEIPLYPQKTAINIKADLPNSMSFCL